MSSFHFNLTIDMLDILIVAFLFYRLFMLIKGTRAIQMFIGLFLLMRKNRKKGIHKKSRPGLMPGNSSILLFRCILRGTGR